MFVLNCSGDNTHHSRRRVTTDGQKTECVIASPCVFMFDLPDSPPGLLSMDPLAGREGTYTLGSNENLGTNLVIIHAP